MSRWQMLLCECCQGVALDRLLDALSRASTCGEVDIETQSAARSVRAIGIPNFFPYIAHLRNMPAKRLI